MKYWPDPDPLDQLKFNLTNLKYNFVELDTSFQSIDFSIVKFKNNNPPVETGDVEGSPDSTPLLFEDL